MVPARVPGRHRVFVPSGAPTGLWTGFRAGPGLGTMDACPLVIRI